MVIKHGFFGDIYSPLFQLCEAYSELHYCHRHSKSDGLCSTPCFSGKAPWSIAVMIHFELSGHHQSSEPYVQGDFWNAHCYFDSHQQTSFSHFYLQREKLFCRATKSLHSYFWTRCHKYCAIIIAAIAHNKILLLGKSISSSSNSKDCRQNGGAKGGWYETPLLLLIIESKNRV